MKRLVADVVVEVRPQQVLLHMPGAVDIADGRVAWIGPLADAPALDASGSESEERHVGGLLMPGLINAHAHTPMTLLRSVGDGLDLQDWLQKAIWPLEANLSSEDVYWGMLLGSLEMLLSGVTTSQEMYLHDSAMIRATQETGARLVVTPGVVGALHGNDIDGRIADISELHQLHHDPDNRIAVGFGPHSPYDLSPHHVQDLARQAAALDTVLHIHLEETEAEREQVLGAHGKSATQLMADNGVLEARVVAAHGVWLDDQDMALLAEAKASVAHCPQSNLKLGSGFADIAAMRGAGINVCIGTDGPASNDNLDLWDELTLAPSLARGLRRDPKIISAEGALLMATANGGLAVGQPDIGCLTVGSRADIVGLSLDHPSWVPGLDESDILTHLVFAANSRDVTNVWVDGAQVVAGGQHVSVDVHQTMAEAKARAAALRAS